MKAPNSGAGSGPGARRVEDLIAARLDGISGRCRRLLAAAAVLGSEFDVALLVPVAAIAPARLGRLIDEAVRAGLVAATPDATGRMRFAHTLIRQGLYQHMPRSRRLLLHRRAGEALEALQDADRDRQLAELAHHFFQAGVAGEPRKAVEYGRRAGDRAFALLAYEEAARLYRMALAALDPGEPSGRADGDDPWTRCRLLLALGNALASGGDRPAAWDAFVGAARLEREVADVTLMFTPRDPRRPGSPGTSKGGDGWTSGGMGSGGGREGP